MSQINLTNPERQKALERFGYTDREAAFLCLAALHGGYFLRRQYDAFLGCQDGGAATRMIEKALAKAHAQAFTFQQKTQIYHLCARPFYEALGQGDSRNRRLRQPVTIKNKVMGLDFVLANRQHEYLATEQEKVHCFVNRLRVDVAALPTKLYDAKVGQDRTARYFVDKYPIFLADPDVPLRAPVASFCFVDEGLSTLSRFETYLGQYAGLFRSLSQFHLIYVAARRSLFERAQQRFERFLTSAGRDRQASFWEPLAPRLLEYFEARRQFETKSLAGFDRAKLIRLRHDQEEFSGPETEALYERWKAPGGRGVIQNLPAKTVAPNRVCATFSTFLLEHDYEVFGHLTA